MMKKALIAAVALLWAGQAAACNEDLFTIESWSEVEDRARYYPATALVIEARYHGDKPIRMVDAEYTLTDVLGDEVAEGRIERDVRLRPGETVSFESVQMPFQKNRVALIEPEDIVPSTCTTAVVYDDGTIERFGGEPQNDASESAREPE